MDAAEAHRIASHLYAILLGDEGQGVKVDVHFTPASIGAEPAAQRPESANQNAENLNRGKGAVPERRVPQMLRDLARIHDERGATYGDNYKHGGLALLALFPEGITLRTEEEFNRFHLFVYLYGKLSRYARTVKSGGHRDSLDDLAVYAMLLAEYDEECRNEPS